MGDQKVVAICRHQSGSMEMSMVRICFGSLMGTPVVDANHWTPWLTTDNPGALQPPCLCPGNLMISSQQFLQHTGQGLNDVQIRCGFGNDNGEVQCRGVQQPQTGNWHEILSLRATTAADVKWQHGYGINGVKMFAADSSSQADDHSPDGSWLHENNPVGAGRYEAFGGVQARYDGWGLVNLQYWCVPKEVKYTEVSFVLVTHADRDPGGKYSKTWSFEYGMEHGSSSSKELRHMYGFNLDVGFAAEAFSVNAGVKDEITSVVKSSSLQMSMEKTKQTETILWDLNDPMWLYQVVVSTIFVDDDVMRVKGPHLILKEGLTNTIEKLGRFIWEGGTVAWEKDGIRYPVGACFQCGSDLNICDKTVTVSKPYFDSLPLGHAFTCSQMPSSLKAFQNNNTIV